MHLADAFIKSNLHCIQVTVLHFFYQLLLSLGIEPMILALLAPCSTIWSTGKPITRYHSTRAQSLVYKVPGSHTDTHTLWCSLAQKSKTGKYLFFPVLVEFIFILCALVCVLCMCECVFDTRRSVTTELIQSMPIFRAWPRYHAVDKLPVHRGMMWAEPLHWTCTLKHTLTQSAVRIYISGHCTVRMRHAVGPFSFKSSSCINFELTL